LASTSASTATNQAGIATTQAGIATTQAGIATTQAGNASTSASAASTSAGNAATSESNAAATYDLFDDRYLGAKASDPTVDNDGNPLVTGAMYFNTTTTTTRIYNGSGWQDSAAIATSINLSTQVTGILPIANGGTGTTSTTFANLTTNVTGTLPVGNGGTGITSFGAGVATFLGTPSSANLATAVTDETGSGALVFATSPTLSGPTFNDGYTEEVFAVTGTTPALSPTNGSIQTWTLSGNSTPTAGTWAAGQSITLMIDDGTAYTVTWSSVAVTWKTDGGVAPTLNTTGFTVIQLWKVGTTVYGARVGNA
jgi:hypothetical protein